MRRRFIIKFTLFFIIIAYNIFYIHSQTAIASNSIDKSLLPYMNFPWILIKHDKESSMYSETEIPRFPKTLYEIGVSANLDTELATPLIYDGKIILADHEGVFVLEEESGELLWGAEIFFDDLHSRKIKEPQPWTRWKCYGLWEFVQSYGVGQNLYVATVNTSVSSLLAFDIEKGSLLWRAKVNGPITSNLVIGNKKIFVGTAHSDGKVYCFSEDGRLCWSTYIGGNIRGLSIGDSLVFVSSEYNKKLYALNIDNGSIGWTYTHDSLITSPVYREGLIFLGDAEGNLILISKDGMLLWEKAIGVCSSVDGHSYVAIDKRNVYVSSSLGGKSFLISLDFSGNEVGKIEFPEGKSLGVPVVTRSIIVIPTISKNTARIYLLWKRGLTKIYEIELKEPTIWLPKVSAGYGNLYVILEEGDKGYKLLKSGDKEGPTIIDTKTRFQEDYLEIEVKVFDKNSGIYKVFLCKEEKGLEVSYIEMELGRKYVIEPIGGYGINEEIYVIKLPYKDYNGLKYKVIAIDNVGNYSISYLKN